MEITYGEPFQRPNSWTKSRQIVLRVFLLAILSHLFALRFLFLPTHATSCNFFSALLYTVKDKGGKPDRKPHPLSYGLKNPNRNVKSGELSRVFPETSKKLYVHEFSFRALCYGEQRKLIAG
jgi:hypothetical protein